MRPLAGNLLVIALVVIDGGCSHSSSPAPVECPEGTIAHYAPPNGSPDLSCAGSTIRPQLSCNQITIGGRFVDVLTGVPVSDGTVEVLDENESSLAKTNVNDDSTYSISVATGPDGFRGHFITAAQDRWTHDAYWLSRPLVFGQQDFNPGLATSADLVTLAALLNTNAIDPNKAIVDPFAIDCAGNGIPNAIIDIDAPYDARFYAGSVPPDPNLKATTVSNGEWNAALFVNVQPGPVNVTVYAANADGSRGAVLARGRGVARPSYWTAIFTSPE